MDGLRAVNVYVITTDDGLVLIDGGWAIPQAREVLQRGLRSIGAGLGDISRFLATRMHRDHFTMATVLGHELGVDVALGLEERPGLDVFHRDFESVTEDPFVPQLVSAGATDLAEQWNLRRLEQGFPDLAIWRYPDTWIEGDQAILVGDRFIDAVHTPGHTPGHFVFAERQAGLLFAGDHVLPTITPSIGFIIPPAPQPLGDFMTSLAKVRGLARSAGPPGARSRRRVDSRQGRRAAAAPREPSGPVPGGNVGGSDHSRRRCGSTRMDETPTHLPRP
jgi:glyoxylase-like metal-dependent hydrolase (beta-lactamase superfamily II)